MADYYKVIIVPVVRCNVPSEFSTERRSYIIDRIPSAASWEEKLSMARNRAYARYIKDVIWPAPYGDSYSLNIVCYRLACPEE